MGMKWVETGGMYHQFPPKYRKILPPVGVIVLLKSACRWGGDGTGRESDGGKPATRRVDIENNGTVHLTNHSRQSEDRQTVSVSGMKHK